ncbi:MAG: rhodanese-like domain-containing protein [Flavobacteriaceae bacterium]|nr:rhodanese-like domain-containing protein [Flavobacteriaceae bacterium]
MKQFFVVCLFLVSCTQQQPQLQLVEKEAFELLMKQEVQLIDVRTSGEFYGGTIGDAQNIDFNAPDFKAQVSKLDKDKPVLVFCAAGGRSAGASKVLESLGFKRIYDLKGGYRGW